MAKIKNGNELIEINCEVNNCGSCSYHKEQKCELFDVLLDHVVNSDINLSGWKRHSKCVAAEVS
jgi:hypothetical protein